MIFNNRNISISPSAIIGKNVKIGDNSIIFDNVTIGDNSVISHNCIIGEPLHNYYKGDECYSNPATFIGNDSIIKSHTIIYAGNKIGQYFNSAHRALIRENCVIGDHCMVGVNVEVQSNVSVGDFSRLYSNVTIAEGTIIGKYVFIFPYVITTNDPNPPSYNLKGPEIGDFSVICSGSTILPNIKLGRCCVVGATSLVSKSFPDNSFLVGNPAKYVMNINDYKVIDVGRPYPWMKKFIKGMPWEKIGFEAWANQNQVNLAL